MRTPLVLTLATLVAVAATRSFAHPAEEAGRDLSSAGETPADVPVDGELLPWEEGSGAADVEEEEKEEEPGVIGENDPGFIGPARFQVPEGEEWEKLKDDPWSIDSVRDDVDSRSVDDKTFGFDLTADNSLSNALYYWRTLVKTVNSDNAGHLCAFKEDSRRFNIEINKFMADMHKSNRPAPEGVPDSKFAEAAIQDTAEVAATAATDDPAADLVDEVGFGMRERPAPMSDPSPERIAEENAAHEGALEGAFEAAGESPNPAGDLLVEARARAARAASVSPGEEHDDLTAGSFGKGPHYHTAVHALRSLRALAGHRAHRLPGADVLFEGLEHEGTFPKEQKLKGIESSTIELRNGVKVTYAEVIALAGDFYADPECPISTGPIDSGSLASTFGLDGRKDARETVVEKVYEVCGWDYDEHAKKMGEKCPITDDRGRTAIERRFAAAFDMLDFGDAEELKKILKVFEKEDKRIRNPDSAVIDYLDVGDDLNFEYGKITGAELQAVPRPIGVLPVGGRFIDLAGVNWDHFSAGGWNTRVYLAGHQEARHLAAQAKALGDNKLLARAYLMNAFADHYLTDMFSAGHVRTLRIKLHECCKVSGAGMVPWGDLLSKYQHDEGNFHGMYMTSDAAGKAWKAYGDKFWFSKQNAANRRVAQAAVAASIAEIAAAYESGSADTPSEMERHIPRETDKSKNFNDLFKISGSGKVTMREPMDGPYDASPTYTSAFVGASSFFKLRHVAWEREYWYKTQHRTEPVATVDAGRYFSAHDGMGTDEFVMLELLAIRTNAQIRAMKAAYKDLFPNRNIVSDTQSDTSGDFETLLVRLLKANKKEGSISSSQARSYATKLYNAGEGSWGTSESVFIDVLAGNSLERNAKIAEAYATLSQSDYKSLRGAINSEFSGTIREALLYLIPKQQETSHSWDLHAANRIHKAMEGWGTNERRIAQVLRRYSNKELRKIDATYREKYGDSIKSDIESETSLSTESCLVRMASTSKNETPLSSSAARSYARKLYKAGEDRWGTDEAPFYDIICKQSSENVKKIKSAYASISKMSLVAAIKDEMSGSLAECLIGAVSV